MVVTNYTPESVKRTPTNYNEYISSVIYSHFIDPGNGNIITPASFNALRWIYIVLSALWVAASIDQYSALKRNKGRQAYVSVILGIIIIITSIIDIVFLALLARDFSECTFSTVISVSTTIQPSTTTQLSTTTQPATITQPSTTLALEEETTAEGLLMLQAFSEVIINTGIDCKLATGIVMTIVARGYVLLFVNVFLSLSLIVVGTQALSTPSIFKYEQNTIPRVQVPRTGKKSPAYGDHEFFEDVYTAPPFPEVNSQRYSSTPVSLGKNRNSSNYY